MDFNETESQFAVLAESLPQLVWSARPDGHHDYFNRRWHEVTGLTPEQSFGDGWTTAIHPEDLPVILDHWRKSLEAGLPYEQEHRIRRVDGGYSWMLSRGIPIRDMSGRVARWFGTSTNIDDRKKAEEALRSLEEQYRLALAAARLGTWTVDLEKGLVSWDEGTCALFDIPPDGLHSMPLDQAMERIHPEDRPAVAEKMAAATAPGSDGGYEVEYRTVLEDGSIRWTRSSGQVHFTKEGGTSRPDRISGVISDITDYRAAEEARQLLTRELTHRVKNLFAIANGMVSMTARAAKDPKEMATTLRGRLSALSRAHELVQPAPVSGHHAGTEVELKKLVESVLAPYRQQDSHRILVEGAEVQIGSNTTTSLALVLHELATNAAKYGCLSNSEGQLTIRWTIEGDSLEVVWTETGGPPIKDPPSFEGFGSQLAQRSIAGQLGGSLHRDWRSEGLCVHMTMPLSRLGT